MTIIIGNIIALIASLLMVYSGILKKQKEILFVQSLQIGLLALSNIVLGGFTGFIVNIINFIRNFLCYKGKMNVYIKFVLIFLMIVFCLYFNNLGFVGFLPLICSVSYTLFVDTKDVIKFKYINIFNLFLWFIYDFYIMSFTSAIFDFVAVITTFISLIQIYRGR